MTVTTYQKIPQKQPSESDKTRTPTLCDYNMEDKYDKYDDIFNSSQAEKSFHHAKLIATLTERFYLTSFKPFQKNIITATIKGKDTLVVQPRDSGKSLCLSKQEGYHCDSNHKFNTRSGA